MTSRRMEDVWDPVYTVAVAALLDDGRDPTLVRELTALRTAGVIARPLLSEVRLPVPAPDLSPLRDALAQVRGAGRDRYDRIADAVGWMLCDADWPLWAINLPEDVPERRVELVMFDSEVDGPLWKHRGRIGSYAHLRLLSMRGNRLEHELGIDFSALPRFEYFSLSENALVGVPPEIRACQALIHLNLRGNLLSSIDPDELPRSLRWLDIGKNRLEDSEVARLREALPECRIYSYAQIPKSDNS